MRFVFTSAALALASLVASAAEATNIRMLNTWDDRYLGTATICKRFADLVTEKSAGAIAITTFGPETIPPTEQVEPVQSGIFQVLCTYPNFHSGLTTILSALETARPDPEALRSSGGWDVIDRHYGNFGLKTVSIPLAHGVTYFLKAPVGVTGDLKGLSLRTQPSGFPILEALGAAGVVLPPADTYSALERGVVDGAQFPIAGSEGFGVSEVTKYFVPDLPLTMPHIILVNAAFWEQLDQDQKQALLEAGAEVEKEVPAAYEQMNAETLSRHEANGMSASPFSAEARARYLAASKNASRDYAISRGGDDAAELIADIEKTRMTAQ